LVDQTGWLERVFLDTQIQTPSEAMTQEQGYPHLHDNMKASTTFIPDTIRFGTKSDGGSRDMILFLNEACRSVMEGEAIVDGGDVVL
jgi:hypothetical protein